jgi:hypothetical protein
MPTNELDCFFALEKYSALLFFHNNQKRGINSHPEDLQINIQLEGTGVPPLSLQYLYFKMHSFT